MIFTVHGMGPGRHLSNFYPQANTPTYGREMVYRCGFSRRLGPVALMDKQDAYLNSAGTITIGNIGTELARIAMADVEEVCVAIEADCSLAV